MSSVKILPAFSLEKHTSSKGTALLYINFFSTSFKFNKEQKRILKLMLNNYFFFSKEKNMWGFIDKKDNKSDVVNYLVHGLIPERLNINTNEEAVVVQQEKISINLSDYEVKFIENKGWPLYTFALINGVTDITINLKHWFFKNKDNSEKEIVKKMVLSHVIACNEFTSPVIDSFNNKLQVIHNSLYGRDI
jgi:hypothetical protein